MLYPGYGIFGIWYIWDMVYLRYGIRIWDMLYIWDVVYLGYGIFNWDMIYFGCGIFGI